MFVLITKPKSNESTILHIRSHSENLVKHLPKYQVLLIDNITDI